MIISSSSAESSGNFGYKISIYLHSPGRHTGKSVFEASSSSSKNFSNSFTGAPFTIGGRFLEGSFGREKFFAGPAKKRIVNANTNRNKSEFFESAISHRGRFVDDYKIILNNLYDLGDKIYTRGRRCRR